VTAAGLGHHLAVILGGAGGMESIGRFRRWFEQVIAQSSGGTRFVLADLQDQLTGFSGLDEQEEGGRIMSHCLGRIGPPMREKSHNGEWVEERRGRDDFELRGDGQSVYARRVVL